MNTQTFIKFSTLALSLAFGTQAFAQGHGTGGGGQAVRNNNHYELRDLIGNQCSTRTGAELIASMPELKERLDAIQKVYWYFGFSLEREIRKMSFCFTEADFNPAKLPHVDDSNGILMVQAPQSAEFVAIRIFQSKEAYIRNPIYRTFSKLSQAMLIIHETMHSFIPLNTGDRDNRLRNFVNDLSSLDANRPSSAGALEASMKFNRVDFPTRSGIKKNTKFLAFALGTEDQQRESLLNGTITLRQILSAPSLSGAGALIAEDEAYLSSIQGAEANAFVARYCENQDEEVLQKLRAQSTQAFDVDLFCLSLQSTQDDLKSAPSATTLKAVGRKFQILLDGVANSTIEIRRERLQVSGGVRLLSQANGNLENSIELLNLTPIQSLKDSAAVSGETRQMVGLMVTLAKGMDVTEWANVVSQNGLAAKALNSSSLAAKIQALNVPMQDEKRAALDLIPRVYAQFKSIVAQELRLQNLDAYADAWLNLVK